MFRKTDFVEYFLKELIDTKLIAKLPEYCKPTEYEFGVSNNEFRKQGENPYEICNIIRIDSIEVFDKYMIKNVVSVNATIGYSEFETNPMFLKNRNIRLIEYAAFHGSVKIFQYLNALKDIKIDKKLLKFVIHGNCAEIIHKIEDTGNFNYKDKHLKIVIKCHANEIAKYNTTCYRIENYNFWFIEPSSMYDTNNFCLLSIYDYYHCVEFLLRITQIDTLQDKLIRIHKNSKYINDSITNLLKWLNIKMLTCKAEKHQTLIFKHQIKKLNIQ